MQQGAEMARTKKAGPREPNGRISRAHTDVPISVMRAMVDGQKASGWWLTPIGQLCLKHGSGFTQAHKSAADLFALQREEYDIATDAPPRNARAQDVTRIGGRSEKPQDARFTARARDAYAKAVVAVGGWSSPQHRALLHMVVDLKARDGHDMELALLDALTRLVRHYNGRQ